MILYIALEVVHGVDSQNGETASEEGLDKVPE